MNISPGSSARRGPQLSCKCPVLFITITLSLKWMLPYIVKASGIYVCLAEDIRGNYADWTSNQMEFSHITMFIYDHEQVELAAIPLVASIWWSNSTYLHIPLSWETTIRDSHACSVISRAELSPLLNTLSYTLSREYRVVRSRYSRLLFTSEDRLCANSRVREQSTNMTSQCQCPTFAWRHGSFVMTSQC